MSDDPNVFLGKGIPPNAQGPHGREAILELFDRFRPSLAILC